MGCVGVHAHRVCGEPVQCSVVSGRRCSCVSVLHFLLVSLLTAAALSSDTVNEGEDVQIFSNSSQTLHHQDPCSASSWPHMVTGSLAVPG